jgi:hypothetical protein
MQIAFYKAPGKFIDRAIRWWTKGKYSHCELVFSNGDWFSADAWQNKVRFERVRPNPEHWDIVDLAVTLKEELLIRAWCDSQEGKGYDYIGVVLTQVLSLDIEDPKRYFCSELCVAALQRIGRLKKVISHEESPVSLALIYNLY